MYLHMYDCANNVELWLVLLWFMQMYAFTSSVELW